ncbi:hypothetical protein SDC9_69691 [bioreactor metagenome]|uniref:SPOR domain-containing protein n=1 Tax=bioreactor metagenome TaxID=1076179 RepID=A0A644Y3X2_9ZZZZ|nr:hypothetical protein [Rikenellaceae bacterium]
MNRSPQTLFFLYFTTLLLVVLIPVLSIGQEKDYEDPEYFEFTVFLNVPKIGGTDLPALIHENYVLLSVTDLFSFLKIKAESTPGFNSVKGFFIEEVNNYHIDRQNNTIEYKGVLHQLKPGDMVRSETNLYLKADVFGSIFGLECSYNFRSLTVTLKTSVELPVIREIRQEQMRKNIQQLTGDITADSTISRSYPLFRFGMADWNISSNQQINGDANTNMGLRLGAAVAGGELNLALTHNSGLPFTSKNQQYYWRWANNNLSGLRQIYLGKVQTNATSTLNASLIGASISNAPTTYRTSYGTYTLSDFTEPEWMVELYVNNVLIDYKKADASGFFSFEVPLVYGSTAIRLQYYGPWGEVRIEEKFIDIPYNLLPSGNFEYKVTGGILDDSTSRAFSRASMNFGISNSVTLGGGVEYLTSYQHSNEQLIPYINASARIGGSFIASASYDHNVRIKSNLNYRITPDLQLELSYTKYNKGQNAITTSYLEERKLSVFAPIKGKGFSLYTRLSLNNNVTPTSQFYSGDLTLSSNIWGINTSLNTSAQKYGPNKMDIYSTLNLSMRLPGKILFSPNTRYNYTRNDLISYGAKAEKMFGQNWYVGAAFERNLLSDFTTIEFGIRFDLSFARFGFIARRNNGAYTLSQSASGSIMVDARNGYLGAGIRGGVSRGGLVIHPYLDVNGNGKKEKDEPRVQGVNVVINGGQTNYVEKDTLIRVTELEPYTDYLVTFDDIKLDNIAWKLRHKTMRISADPNQFKNIYVPVSVLGEAGGMVYVTRGSSTMGIGRVIINFYRADSTFVGRVLSEEDGYFTRFGFAPGKYFATLDHDQLGKINMTGTPTRINFELEQSIDGDYIDHLEFFLHPGEKQPQDTASKPETPAQEPIKKTEIRENYPSSINTTKSTSESKDTLYSIQIIALKSHNGIYEHLLPLLSSYPDIVVRESYGSDHFYRYSTGEFKNRQEALNLLGVVHKLGWKEAFITSYIPSVAKASITNLIGYVPEKANFMIQLHALKGELEDMSVFNKILSGIPGISIRLIKGSDGFFRYNAGCFNSRKDAISLLRTIRSMGWTDAFIVKVTSDSE